MINSQKRNMIINLDKKKEGSPNFNLYRFIKITKKRKIKGRGDKTAGRGTKGQKSRKSGRVRIGFEGGQNPFYLRFPKRGDRSAKKNKKKNKIINLRDIEKNGDILSGSFLDLSSNINKSKITFKILGEGDFRKKLSIKCDFFSVKSIEKIEKNGGSVQIKK